MECMDTLSILTSDEQSNSCSIQNLCLCFERFDTSFCSVFVTQSLNPIKMFLLEQIYGVVLNDNSNLSEFVVLFSNF